MPLAERISLDPAVCHGKPVIAGTRVMVSIVLGHLAGGTSIEEIMSEYDLKREDVLAAVAYAADLVSSERHYPVVSSR